MKKIVPGLFASLVLAVSPLSATRIFFEDFTGVADGTTLTSSNTDLTAIRTIDGFEGSYIEALDPSLIGDGPAASIFTGSITSGVSVQSLSSAVGTGLTVGTLIFDFYYTGSLGSGNSNALVISSGSGTYFSSSSNSIYTNTDATFGVRFNASGIQNNATSTTFSSLSGTALSAETLYRIAVVFNRSGSAVLYDGGSVGTGRGDLWINGDLVADDFSIRSAKDTGSFALKVTGFESSGPAMTFDNIGFYDTAVMPAAVAVPEPAAVGAVLAGGALGLAAFWRRRRYR